MGRVLNRSNPAEIDGNWNIFGDDALVGRVTTSFAYDWKGRMTQITNTDGTLQNELHP